MMTDQDKQLCRDMIERGHTSIETDEQKAERLVVDALAVDVGREAANAFLITSTLTDDEVEALGRYVIAERQRKYREGFRAA